MLNIKNILCFFGTNQIVLGIASLCGIIGFVLTIVVTIRTNKISKILKRNQLTAQYNRERSGFQSAFEGHQASIMKDDLRTDAILKDILKNVEAYDAKFGELIPLRERFRLYAFKRLLKKEAGKTNWNKICNYLAILSGYLSKKEEMKNG